MKRYPNTVTIFFGNTIATINSLGVYRESATLTTLRLVCNIQPASGKYVAIEGGDRVLYSYDITCPLITSAIPDRAKLQFFSKEFKILVLHHYQKHSEIKV